MRRDISRCKYRVGSHPHPSPLPEREREKSGARCYIANITALPQKVNGKAVLVVSTRTKQSPRPFGERVRVRGTRCSRTHQQTQSNLITSSSATISSDTD